MNRNRRHSVTGIALALLTLALLLPSFPVGGGPGPGGGAPAPAAPAARAPRPGPAPAAPLPVADSAPAAGGAAAALPPVGPAVGPAVGPGRRLYPRTPAPRRATPEETALAVLEEFGPRLGLDRMPGRLALRRSFSSPVGDHVRWGQVSAGVPVFGSEVSVHVAPDGRILVVNADIYPVPAALPPVSVTAEEALLVAVDATTDGDGEEVATKEPRLVWLPREKSARLTWLVDTRGAEESLRVFVDAATGEILDERDLRRSAEGTGQVFAPNPIFSSRNSALKDGGDADSPALTGQLITVPLRRLDGTGYLRGAWVDLTPTAGDAFNPQGAFLYTRSDDRFEQVNCYHHIDSLQDYIRTVLGFTDVHAHPQKVNAHGLVEDNSYFDEFNGFLYFGDGGVDDGEDGDVIAHEYGHSIQNDQVPGFGLTPECGAMGEGFGDYIAATRHASGFPAFDGAVASWDAASFTFGNPPALRRVDGSKIHPRDFVGEVHEDGEIWSSALWAIRGILGAADADRIVIGSHFLLTATASFSDGAAAILAANESLRGGADASAIRTAFAARGIPAGDDPLEPDDTSSSATLVRQSHLPDLFLQDDDWFRFEVQAGSSVTVSADFLHPLPDLDMKLYGEALDLLATSESPDDGELLSTGTVDARTTFLLRVYPWGGTKGPYALTFTGGLVVGSSDPFEPNGGPEEAKTLATGFLSGMDLEGESDEDWFRLPGVAGTEVRVTASFDPEAVDLDLELRAPDGTVLDFSRGTGPVESIAWIGAVGAPPEVFLRVTSAAGSGPYTLNAAVLPLNVVAARGRLKGVLAAGEELVLGLDVASDGLAPRTVFVNARRKGRRGAVPEVEVRSPGGILLVPFGTGDRRKGSLFGFEAVEPGQYRLRLRPAFPTEGAFRLRTKVK